MSNARIQGIAMTRQGRLDTSVGALARAAVRGALADAEIEMKGIALIIVANGMAGLLSDQEMVRGQSWLKSEGFSSIPVINVDNACASSATALHVGCLAIDAGTSPVLVVGAEKMWADDRRSVGHALEHALAADERDDLRATVGADAPSVFMGLNAHWAQVHMERWGSTREQFAAAAAKSRWHGSLNPLAQHQSPMTVEEILASSPIAGVLSRHMCSSFTDGAAAVVLSASTTSARAPRILASALRSGDGSMEYHDRIREAADLAWKIADLGPDDMDIVELHDATSAEELYALEALGLFEPGDAGPATVRGLTSIGSPGLVVNPSGGLVARGHAIGATGLCQVVEVVMQLRGEAGARQVENARVGMTLNTGGILGEDTAAAACHVVAM
jgi:acetyl-CoA acyltransferase